MTANQNDDRVREAVEASSTRDLDDVSRARIKQKLMRQVERETTRVRTVPAPRQGPGWRWTAAVAALGLAVLSGVLLDRWRESHPPPADLHLMVVRSVANPTATGGSLKRMLGRPTRELKVPNGTSVRATVGDAGIVTIMGGSRVTMVAANTFGLEVRLHSGTMAAQVRQAANRRFVVSTPEGTVSVVGTNFAVQVVPAGLRVAVERGMVVVRPTGRNPVVVQAGQGWSTGTTTPTPMPPGLHQLLLAHRAGKPVAGALRQFEVPRPNRLTPPKQAMPARGPDAAKKTRSPDPERLYARAEAALRQGKHKQAIRLLRRLARLHVSSPLRDTARYDLARLALDRGKTDQARKQLKKLLATGRDRSLRDPAHFMLCRIEVKVGDTKHAVRCLATFRGLYPLSPHDQEALHLLAHLRLKAAGGCGAAAPLAKEYLRRYPKGLFAAPASALLTKCAK